jgi:hypothetical protein
VDRVNFGSVIITVLMASAALLPATSRAADSAAAGWLVATHSGTLSTGGVPGPWRYGVQGQLRYFDRGDGVSQFVFRPGISYRLNSRFSLAGGYAYYRTDARGLGTRNEHRAWQQLDWNMAYWDSSVLRSRTRLEQRFVQDQSDTAWWLRQRFYVEFPVSPESNTTLKAGAEVFFQLRETHWTEQGYAQSRLFIGLAWGALGRETEFGYLYQHNRVRNLPDLVNHVFVLVLKL